MVHTSRTINLDWSTALAWNVICRLQKKYKPEDTISARELNKRLEKLRINETEHPDHMFDKLDEINIAYGYLLDEAK